MEYFFLAQSEGYIYLFMEVGKPVNHPFVQLKEPRTKEPKKLYLSGIVPKCDLNLQNERQFETLNMHGGKDYPTGDLDKEDHGNPNTGQAVCLPRI